MKLVYEAPFWRCTHCHGNLFYDTDGMVQWCTFCERTVKEPVDIRKPREEALQFAIDELVAGKTVLLVVRVMKEAHVMVNPIVDGVNKAGVLRNLKMYNQAHKTWVNGADLMVQSERSTFVGRRYERMIIDYRIDPEVVYTKILPCATDGGQGIYTTT